MIAQFQLHFLEQGMGHGDAAVDVEDQVGPLASRDLLLENQIEPLYYVPDSNIPQVCGYPEACAESIAEATLVYRLYRSSASTARA